jgi:hypothetical protein
MKKDARGCTRIEEVARAGGGTLAKTGIYQAAKRLIHEHQVCVVMALGQALRKLDHATRGEKYRPDPAYSPGTELFRYLVSAERKDFLLRDSGTEISRTAWRAGHPSLRFVIHVFD